MSKQVIESLIKEETCGKMFNLANIRWEDSQRRGTLTWCSYRDMGRQTLPLLNICRSGCRFFITFWRMFCINIQSVHILWLRFYTKNMQIFEYWDIHLKTLLWYIIIYDGFNQFGNPFNYTPWIQLSSHA